MARHGLPQRRATARPTTDLDEYIHTRNGVAERPIRMGPAAGWSTKDAWDDPAIVVQD